MTEYRHRKGLLQLDAGKDPYLRETATLSFGRACRGFSVGRRYDDVWATPAPLLVHLVLHWVFG